MEHNRARASVAEVAKAMKMDQQTVRILIQQRLVPWGQAVKLPGSTRYMYIISPVKFFQETGVRLRGMADDTTQNL